MYEFKKLSDVEVIETVQDGATVLVEDGGKIRRTPKSKIGTVKTVNGVEPDETGDVVIDIPTHSWDTLDGKPFDIEFISGTKEIWLTPTGESSASNYDNLDVDIAKVVYDNPQNVTVSAYGNQYTLNDTYTEDGSSRKWLCIDDNGGSSSSRYIYVDLENGEPSGFIGSSGFSGSPPVGIFVTTTTEVIHSLDSKFIGDDIARVSDIPEAPQQVQADLTQNDPEAPDYVKGRLFGYPDGFEDAFVIDNQTVTTVKSSYGSCYKDIGSMVDIVTDVEYTVIFNDDTYTFLPVQDSFGLYYIGSDNNDPFNIILYPNQDKFRISTPTEETFTLSIYYNRQKIKTLDEVYLPSGTMIGKRFKNGAESFNITSSNETSATGNNAHAEGASTKASGNCSHAEGESSTASGHNSHAEGFNTTASENTSHAEGWGTKARGEASHAEGQSTIASGKYSHAEGSATSASGYSQHVQGKYNIIDDNDEYAHIVGNGKGLTSRSNAHTLDWSGNAWYQGTVKCTAVIVKSSTEGSTKRFKITVDDSGTISATEITE